LGKKDITGNSGKGENIIDVGGDMVFRLKDRPLYLILESNFQTAIFVEYTECYTCRILLLTLSSVKREIYF
jgi:hypothetical protein